MAPDGTGSTTRRSTAASRATRTSRSSCWTPSTREEPDFTEINPLAARLLTEELCRHFRMLPIAYRDGVVNVAFCDPFDKLAVELATALTASEVQSVLAAPDDVEDAIARTFGPLWAPHFEDLGPPPSDAPRVGDLLVANGATTDEQIEAALAEQRRTGSRLGEVLLHAGAISEADLDRRARRAAAAAAAATSRAARSTPRRSASIPEAVARELRVVPVAADETTLYLAVADALDDDALADAAIATPTWRSSRSSRRSARSTRSSRRPTARSTCTSRSTIFASACPRTAPRRS